MSLEYLKTYVRERIADGAIDAGDPTADEHNAALKRGLADIEVMQEDVETLDALRAAGVDNWEGYDFAMDVMSGDY